MTFPISSQRNLSRRLLALFALGLSLALAPVLAMAQGDSPAAGKNQSAPAKSSPKKPLVAKSSSSSSSAIPQGSLTIEFVTFRLSKEAVFKEEPTRHSASLDLKIKNDNVFRVKDLQVSCQMVAPSGTILGESSETLYEAIEAKSTKEFAAKLRLNSIHYQTLSLNCQISGAQKG